MIVILPIFNDETRYTETIILENIEYLLTLDWNSREGFWYLTISDIDETPIRGLLGIKVVVNWQLNRFVSDVNFPKGILFTMNETDLDPTQENLKLVYVDEETWLEIQNG